MKDLSYFSGHHLDGLTFCKEVYALFEEIRSIPDGVSNLRLKASVLEKKLLEELFPICRYTQTKYKPGLYLTVQWIDGNQQFDAFVGASGESVKQFEYPAHSFLEVTSAVHPKEYLARERLHTHGLCYGYDGLKRIKGDRSIMSEVVSYSGLSFINDDAERIVDAINKKGKINYPDNTTLIVQSSLSTIYSLDEWRRLVDLVRSKVKSIPFFEIFICETGGHFTDSLYPYDNPQ